MEIRAAGHCHRHTVKGVNSMQYDNIIMPEHARKAARILKQYCEQNGCLYCCFYSKEENANFCALKTVPREYPEQFREGGKHYA